MNRLDDTIKLIIKYLVGFLILEAIPVRSAIVILGESTKRNEAWNMVIALTNSGYTLLH